MEKNDKNPFRKLETNEELPENIKDKVMTSVNFGILIRDFTELFTAKAGQTALEFLKGEDKKDSSKSDPKEDEESKE